MVGKIDDFYQRVQNIIKIRTELKQIIDHSNQKCKYDADRGIIIESRCKWYENVFLVDGFRLAEAAKVRLLMQTLGAPEYSQYCNYIMPNHTPPRSQP